MSYEKALEKIKQAAESGASELNLSGMKLEYLPPEIGQLTNLQRLTLWSNHLTTLPLEIGQLTNLQELGLRNNHLTVWPSGISLLINLQHLDLGNNSLMMLPPEIGQLVNLQYLNLCDNSLMMLPPEIGQLVNLQCLALDGNRLTTLPSEIGHLSKLDRLYLSELRLQSWPEQGPSKLGTFMLWNCRQLTYLPNWLKRVDFLYLGGCEQLSRLPDQLQIVELIDLADTHITSLPSATALDIEIHWWDVPIDRHIAFEPETITVQEIFAEENLEVRRVMVARMGHERFLHKAEPVELDQDVDVGGVRRLLRVDWPDSTWPHNESFVGLEVIDPSTGRQYILRVPPDMQTCQQAAAWIAGFDNPDDYRPVQET